MLRKWAVLLPILLLLLSACGGYQTQVVLLNQEYSPLRVSLYSENLAANDFVFELDSIYTFDTSVVYFHAVRSPILRGYIKSSLDTVKRAHAIGSGRYANSPTQLGHEISVLTIDEKSGDGNFEVVLPPSGMIKIGEGFSRDREKVFLSWDRIRYYRNGQEVIIDSEASLLTAIDSVELIKDCADCVHSLQKWVVE